jgi:hypothetical protein
MGTFYSPNIVKDGLILCLDAGNIRSYPSSGTSFFDLSGYGNTHTIVNSPTFSNGKFVFNNTSMGFTKSSALTGATSTCTVVLWYKSNNDTELWVRGNQSNGTYLSASYGNPYYHSGVGSPTNYVDLNTVTNPTTPVNYRDNVYHMWEAKNVDFTGWTYFEWFQYPDPWFLSGEVAAIMIYNRALTSAESNTNFSALRNRYGI